MPTIELVQGDILKADAEALVNTVNCVGVMGRGIALQFKKAFPENFKTYERACKANQVQIGRMLVYDLNRVCNPHWIINFPTKNHWKSRSHLGEIELGLLDLVNVLQQYQIRSIAIPPLGCGLGGLDWRDVKPLITEALGIVPEVKVLLFEPAGAPQGAEMVKGKRVPTMTIGRAALLGLMGRYLTAAMDPTVTLLEVHKLMYFMQESGEVLRLNYGKGIYGPYAENLRHVLNHIEGHFIDGYGDAEDRPDKSLELNPNAAEQARLFLVNHEKTRQRFDRVVDLIKGFETPFGMELLATVHWVATREGATTAAEAVIKVHGWNVRKKMFNARHIHLAWSRLGEAGWLT